MQYKKQQRFLEELLVQKQAFEGQAKASLSEQSRLELLGLDKKIASIQTLILGYEASEKALGS